MKEEWRDIKEYEGLYQVSNLGNIRNAKTNKNLKLTLDAKGYLKFSAYKNGKQKTLKVHRLVAETFIPNPDNKPTVDHINTIKTDNKVSNLRWFTYKEQMSENEITKKRNKEVITKIALLGLEKHKKKVMCLNTGKIFNSTYEAARYYNIKDVTAVSHAANPNNKQKTAGKLPDGTRLEWKYI